MQTPELKKYCFLMLCQSHSGDLSGKLAILTTDCLTVARLETSKLDEFQSGSDVMYAMPGGGYSSAIILADLNSTGYRKLGYEKMMAAVKGFSSSWKGPDQFLEVGEIAVTPKR